MGKALRLAAAPEEAFPQLLPPSCRGHSGGCARHCRAPCPGTVGQRAQTKAIPQHGCSISSFSCQTGSKGGLKSPGDDQQARAEVSLHKGCITDRAQVGFMAGAVHGSLHGCSWLQPCPIWAAASWGGAGAVWASSGLAHCQEWGVLHAWVGPVVPPLTAREGGRVCSALGRVFQCPWQRRGPWRFLWRNHKTKRGQINPSLASDWE